MKNFLLALMVVLTTCTLAIAQNQTTVVRDFFQAEDGILDSET